MSQQDLVEQGDLEIVFGGEFSTSQLSVEMLGRMTGIDFHKLNDADTFRVSPEMATEALESMRRGEAPLESVHSSPHFKQLQSLDDVVTSANADDA